MSELQREREAEISIHRITIQVATRPQWPGRSQETINSIHHSAMGGRASKICMTFCLFPEFVNQKLHCVTARTAKSYQMRCWHPCLTFCTNTLVPIFPPNILKTSADRPYDIGQDKQSHETTCLCSIMENAFLWHQDVIKQVRLFEHANTLKSLPI